MTSFVPTIFVTIVLLYINSIRIYCTENSTLNDQQLPVDHIEEPKHVNLILSKLREQQALKCDYGSNPLVFDICNNIDLSNYENYIHKDLRVEDIVNVIIRPKLVRKLQKACDPGEWCFKKIDSGVIKHPLGKRLMTNHASMLCMFASCYSNAKSYINNCVSTEMSKNVLSTVPVLCEASDKENQYCLESTMQLFHVSAAVLKGRKNGDLINNCEKKLTDDKTCNYECKKIAVETNKLEYCCSNTSLIKSFKPLNWITDYTNNVETYCDLPITSICFSEGKYYIGLSPNLVMVLIIAVMLTMTCFFLFIYICCMNSKQIKVPFVDSLSYSQLNNDVEEEMNLVDAESDNELKYDFNSQQGISRFVNEHQTDIKDLLN